MEGFTNKYLCQLPQVHQQLLRCALEALRQDVSLFYQQADNAIRCTSPPKAALERMEHALNTSNIVFPIIELTGEILNASLSNLDCETLPDDWDHIDFLPTAGVSPSLPNDFLALWEATSEQSADETQEVLRAWDDITEDFDRLLTRIVPSFVCELRGQNGDTLRQACVVFEATRILQHIGHHFDNDIIPAVAKKVEFLKCK